MRSLRNQGRDTDGTWLRHVRLGYNYRLDELSAALGVAQLERLAELRAGRARVAAAYEAALGGPGLGATPTAGAGRDRRLVRLRRPAGAPSDRSGHGDGRARSSAACQRPYFAPLHLQPYYRERSASPRATSRSRSGRCLDPRAAILVPSE